MHKDTIGWFRSKLFPAAMCNSTTSFIDKPSLVPTVSSACPRVMGRPEHMEPTTQPNAGDGCSAWHPVLDTASTILRHLEVSLWESPLLRLPVHSFWWDSRSSHSYPLTRWPDDQPGVSFLWMVAVKDTVRMLHNDILSPWFLTGSLIVTNDLCPPSPAKLSYQQEMVPSHRASAQKERDKNTQAAQPQSLEKTSSMDQRDSAKQNPLLITSAGKGNRRAPGARVLFVFSLKLDQYPYQSSKQWRSFLFQKIFLKTQLLSLVERLRKPNNNSNNSSSNNNNNNINITRIKHHCAFIHLNLNSLSSQVINTG